MTWGEKLWFPLLPHEDVAERVGNCGGSPYIHAGVILQPRLDVYALSTAKATYTFHFMQVPSGDALCNSIKIAVNVSESHLTSHMKL